jgi:hypothetical protein
MPYEVNSLEQLEYLTKHLPDYIDDLKVMFLADGKIIFFHRMEKEQIRNGALDKMTKELISWWFNDWNRAHWVAFFPTTLKVVGSLMPDHGAWPVDQAIRIYAGNRLPVELFGKSQSRFPGHLEAHGIVGEDWLFSRGGTSVSPLVLAC